MNNQIEVVSGLNALEVKGLIGSSYLCITSRFHGAASSLNSCVPCLATSWSHKYVELFKTYGFTNNILPLSNFNETSQMITDYLVEDNNSAVRLKLFNSVMHIKQKNREMWNMLWNI